LIILIMLGEEYKCLFVFITLKEIQLATLNVLPFIYTRDSALVIVLSDSPCDRIGKLKCWPILKDRWYAFSWSICDKNCRIIKRIESDSF
jgi:hypothetical protein